MLFSVSERARTGTDHVAPVPARLLAAPARPSAVPAQLVRDVLHGSGQPLTMSLKEEMEGRLGADFSNVRVHTGEAARASAAEIGARAYTVGNHVVIGDGGANKHMLAHELTHVIQQRSGPVAGADRGGGLKVSDPSDRDERTAVANAARVMRAPLNENRLARAGTGEPGTGERGIGAAQPAAVPPIVVQRYFYDIPAVHGENPEIKGKTVDVLPASRQRYEDDYDPLRALNLRRKHREQMHEPVRNQIFIDNPAYASRMRGYLKDTVMESKRVAGAANAVLTGLREHLKHHPDFSRSMMIGVIETLDGNLRVANSGGTSGPVNDIVRDLDKVSGAAMKAREDQEREPNEPLRKARKNPKDVGSRVSVVDPVSTENFESYLKAGVLSGHLNCAAPQLILSALGVGDTLDIRHLTEVWWEPTPEKGKRVWKGVMVNGVRYHHLQRVPSCEHCEQNLRVLVNSQMRSALLEEFTQKELTGEAGVRGLKTVTPDNFGGGSQERRELAVQQQKRMLYNNLIERVEPAEEILSATSLQDFPEVWAAIKQLRDRIYDTVFDARVAVADYIPEWKKAMRDTVKALNNSSVPAPLLHSKVRPAIKLLNEAVSLPVSASPVAYY